MYTLWEYYYTLWHYYYTIWEICYILFEDNSLLYIIRILYNTKKKFFYFLRVLFNLFIYTVYTMILKIKNYEDNIIS